MIRGSLEMTDAARVAGWALDSANPTERLRVEIFLDDAKLGEVIAGEGTSGHAFDILLDQPVAPDDRPRIRAVITPVVEVDPAAAEAAWALIERSGLFDPGYYGGLVGHDLTPQDMLRHYLVRGEREGARPHPLFDPAFVRARLAAAGVGIGEGGVLATYLRHPDLDIDPHPLFDTEYFRRAARRPLRLATGLEQYLALGGAGGPDLSPCRLFDPGYYLDTYPDVRRSDIDPFLHYARFGAQEGRAPHPLFRAAYLRESLDRLGVRHPGDADLLAFYLREPDAWAAAPHPLFDPEYHADARESRGLSAVSDEAPLAALLRSVDDISPCRQFDPDFYRAQAAAEGVAVEGLSIVHYLKRNAAQGFDPHPLFSVRRYLARYPEASRPGREPLSDFIEAARAERREPSQPSPQAHLADQARAMLGGGRNLPRGSRVDGYGEAHAPHPLFEARLYAARNRDCRTASEAPLVHYARAWGSKGLRFPIWGTALHPRRNMPDDHGPFDVVFVSHELTRTGAPAILLKIIEDLTRRRGVRGLTLAVNGGDRLEDFRDWTPVVDLAAIRAAGTPDAAFVEDLAGAFSASARPKLVIVNTACADHIANAFVAADIPVVTLVHEIASTFEARVFENIYACSERVIFPAAFVRDEAHRAHVLPAGKDAVAPQGLLDPAFGGLDPDRARRDAVAELGLPEDAFIVLAAGTMDLRKGMDVFVRVAAQVHKLRARDGGGPPVHFVWLGEGDRRSHSPFSFVLEDAKRLGVADQVHFPGARLDAEPYFTACDLFVLPSRLDPFPCVVHEAMACAKPVIAFAGAGGAPEALADGAGIVVDYGDAEAMAAEVWRLACDAEARRALGERARARVASAYVFADYVDRLAEVIAEGTGVDLGAPIDTANGTVAPKRVFFTAARWEASGRSAFVASLIEGLGRRGFAAELVLTGRGPILHALEDLPDVPTTILPDTLRRSMSHRETWRKLTALLGGAGTAVFIPVFDEAGAALTPILPPRVGALEIAFDGDPGLEERVMRLGRYWQRMTAVSQSTAETALTLAPGLQGRIEAIPWEAGGSDLEAVCDRYAQLLDQMFAELRAGAYVRPPPAFIHPELGGISLPPSLVLHPDLAPPGRPPR